MSVEEELASLKPERDTLLTIGVFDGVHYGHQYLVSQLKKRAAERGLLSGVVTFEPHPQGILFPQSELAWLTDLAERRDLLRSLGVDFIAALSFTPDLARIGAREFVSLLQKYLRMRGLVVGPDFALGRDREGNTTMLQALGKEMGFSVEAIPPMVLGGDVVSSSTIRRILAEGEVRKFRKLVGRYFSLQGQVVGGAERGRSLGFPTANLDLDPQRALPRGGVYAAQSYVADGVQPAVVNIGRRPTFGGGELIAEVYILDYQGDLYGHKLRVDLVERLRDEMRFASPQELQAQIRKDVEQAKAALKSEAGKDNARP